MVLCEELLWLFTVPSRKKQKHKLQRNDQIQDPPENGLLDDAMCELSFCVPTHIAYQLGSKGDNFFFSMSTPANNGFLGDAMCELSLRTHAYWVPYSATKENNRSEERAR